MLLDWSRRRQDAGSGLWVPYAEVWGGAPAFQSTGLRLSWSVAGRPAEVRLSLTWTVSTPDGAAVPRPRLRLTWTVGVSDPVLHLVWLVVSQGLAGAHASPSRQPVAEVILETP